MTSLRPVLFSCPEHFCRVSRYAPLGGASMLRQFVPVLGMVWALTGCVNVVHQSGPPQPDFVSFDRDNAELVRVNLKMGAGEMRVSSGTDKLARADFEFSIPEWKPQVSYAAGTLRISQPEGSGKTLGNVK